MILLIDNYDSFSYNLYQLIGAIEPDIRVERNDSMSAEELIALHPSGIILSPGPGRPEQAGVLPELIRVLSEMGAACIPTLGVCLGHQAICQAFGGTIGYARELMHGKQSDTIFDRNSPLFQGLPEVAKIARYHSLALVPDTLPEVLQITARTTDGDVMAVAHKQLPIYGLQFHPESIMTPDGPRILENFIGLTR